VTLIPSALPESVPAPITVGGQIITANSVSQYIVSGQTLIPGGTPITIGGTPVSLGTSATNVVIGSSTSGLGTIIISGIGGTQTAGTPAFTAPAFTGAAHGMRYSKLGLVAVTAMIATCLGL
jgi:hypothetical protein